MILKDIRNPEKHLLQIFAAATLVDTAGIFIWKRLSANSPINKWYSQLELTAYAADILSLMIALVLAQFITYYIGGAWKPAVFLLVAVGIQMFHDLFFSKIVLPAIPTDKNTVVDIMKEYVNIPFSAGILLVDMSYVVLASLLAMWLAGRSSSYSVLLLVVWLYVGMFVLYDRPGSTLAGTL
jgi:hypothetical protein